MMDSLFRQDSKSFFTSIISKLFIIFITRTIFARSSSNPNTFFGPDKLYYKAPAFSIKNTNVTFVGSKYVGTTRTDQSSVVNLGKSIAVLCQADMINRKVTNYSIDGVMNIVFSDYTDETGSGQQAVTDLLANNLYYYTNNSRANSAQGDLDITGFINLGVFGTAKINSFASNFFDIPAINSGDSARNNPDNQFISPFESANRTFFDFLNSEIFNTFNATIQLTQYFNWTLVGSLFAANSYGYTRQKDTITYASTSSNPIFTCSFIVPVSDLDKGFDAAILNSFCTCINSKNKIQVIVLWMSTTISISVINYLRNTCPGADELTFIVTTDYQTPFDYSRFSSFNLKYTLLIRNIGLWDYQNYIDECKADASPAAKPLINESIAEYYRLAYKCTTRTELNLPQCPNSLLNRTELCICTGNEFNLDPYASRYFFTSDMISGYAYALNLLQNNCSMLNQMERNFALDVVDFCKITNFSPGQLAFALRFINYTGYTGPIYFPSYVMRRAVKTYYLYMNNTLTGMLTPSGPTINVSLIHWINNKTPISKIVPQNPGLEYPSVAAFFYIAIIELIICIVVIIFYLLNFKHIIIRRNAPYVSFVMLIGVTFLAISQIIISLSDTNATCNLSLYFYRFGLCLLISGLVVKNYRIYRIFSNKQAVAIHMPESELLTYIGLAAFIYLGIITVFVCVFGFEAVLFTSSYDRFYEYVECAIPNKTWNVIFKFFIQIQIIIVILINLYLAWLTHNIKSEYSESNQLAAFSLLMGTSFAIFIPLSLTLGDSVNSAVLRTIIDDIYLTIVVISALAILFIPKIWIIYSLKRKEQRLRARESAHSE